MPESITASQPANANAATASAGAAISANAAGGSARPAQTTSLPLRLMPANNSDQPVLANTNSVQRAPGLAYIDFGYIEPAVLAALPRVAQQGGKLPEAINGKLAVRVVMGFDGVAHLQQQLSRVMAELAKAVKQVAGVQA